MTTKSTYGSIDAYLESRPNPIRERLQAIRDLVHDVVPDATEAISYQMPTFKLGGNLLHFAGRKRHISIYPSTSAIEDALPGIAQRSNGKGTIQFPNSEPLPLDLIRQYIELRVAEVNDLQAGVTA